MPYYGSVNVIDRSGWSRRYNLEKSLLMIGSASVNDILLPLDRGSGVASIHLQVVHPQADQSRIRVVNLVNTMVTLRRAGSSENAAISANGSADLADGDSILLGDFILTFSIQSHNGFTSSARSDHMGIKLELPALQMKAGTRLAGRLTVSNYGEQKRCQFEIELEGLPGDCYLIDPVPLLFPKGEEYLQIRFFHRGSRPLAGACPIQLKATAPGTYPTEAVLLPVILDIMPVYRYEVSIENAESAEVKIAGGPSNQPARIEPPMLSSPPFRLQPAHEPEPLETPMSFTPVQGGPVFTSQPLLDEADPGMTPGDAQDIFTIMPEPILPPNFLSPPLVETRQDHFANPGQVRRPRLPLKGQPIQVLKTPEEPPVLESGAGQTGPVKENKEP